MPDVRNLRIPVRYLANMLTAGDEAPIVQRAGADAGDARLHALENAWTASSTKASPRASGLSGRVIEEMYKVMALADYEDRFVIPTTHREQVEDAYDIRRRRGFTDCNGCSTGMSKGSLFGGQKTPAQDAAGGAVMDAYSGIAR